MIVCSLDFETTGVDVENDRVIEVGAVLYSTNQKKCIENLGVLVKTDRPITSEVTRLTGITQAALDRFGYESDQAFELLQPMIENAQAIIGYNCRRFDRRVYEKWASLEKSSPIAKPWIDVFMDLPFGVPTGKLSHTAADHGFLNLFPHSALSDAQTVIGIANEYDYDILLQRAQSPVVIAIAKTDRSENDLVKQAKFRWNPSRKIWWKAIKESDLDEFKRTITFRTVIDKETSVEELDN